jgi:hypothetical protein
MAQPLFAFLLPLIVSIGLLFSWQAKKKRTEKQKSPDFRVTVLYNPSPQNLQSVIAKKQPQFIRMAKACE